MKQVCRMDKTNKRPYCLRKPCSYRLDGSCSGPVVAVKDYYSFAASMQNVPIVETETTFLTISQERDPMRAALFV
ncbi:hypothetical protein [Gemmiger formicilis]|uniref:hypothetical protein n=1 Tax=Gemmiger formicilis TaxID=745368 RepID=UPI00241C26C7|nr:hypothetical protein [Gemmiger formicilis]